MDDQLPMEDVLAQLSERGRVEWELAVTKALLAREQERNARLVDQLERASRPASIKEAS